MPLIPQNKSEHFNSVEGPRSGSTPELVDQLQEQFRIERASRFNLAELAIALRELAELRLKLARIEAFVVARSPSASVH
jgi:hypothetical protein